MVLSAHALAVANNVTSLMSVNLAWIRGRVCNVREAGFGLCRIVLIEMPPNLSALGFQLGVIHRASSSIDPLELMDLPGA